jgi:restriction system protein
MNLMAVPKYDEMYNALLRALQDLGGSASIQEMEKKVAEILNLSEKDINEMHRGNRTKFSYRLAWTRTYLKNYGLLENSSLGVWALTQKGRETKIVDKEKVNNFVKDKSRESSSIEEEAEEGKSPENSDKIWEDDLLDVLMSMDPSAFERLCQRVLRESGFIEVKVTGRTGDGGIDGKGIIRLAGLIGFRVVFQCKRWKGTVSSKEIRDFRGAMDGRADKGLFITTGKFTREATDEATRDGAFPIDLIDGQMLVQKIKELNLGVKISTKEEVEINKDWFKSV